MNLLMETGWSLGWLTGVGWPWEWGWPWLKLVTAMGALGALAFGIWGRWDTWQDRKRERDKRRQMELEDAANEWKKKAEILPRIYSKGSDGSLTLELSNFGAHAASFVRGSLRLGISTMAFGSEHLLIEGKSSKKFDFQLAKLLEVRSPSQITTEQMAALPSKAELHFSYKDLLKEHSAHWLVLFEREGERFIEWDIRLVEVAKK